MDDLVVERVLRCCECVPAGRLATYGMVARLAGTSPRLVGRIMSVYGANVSWWRIVNARGELPAALAVRARPHWEDEAVTYVGPRARLPEHRVDEATWAAACVTVLADLPAR
jgi:methylated-DNA-protein-cysteine methyltransferase-like protein